MGAALLVSRLVLACVFAVAGGAKLADPAGARRAVVGFGVPQRLSGVAGIGLPVCELAVALALLPVGSARYGALGAGLLLAAFVVAIANAMLHGRAPDCHCFGQVHSEPAGWRTLARNAVLLGLAGFVAAAGWGNPGWSATGWLTGVQAGWLVGGTVGIVALVLVGFQVWFSLQLLSQNGRMISRLEALEQAVAGFLQPPALDGATVVRPLGAGLSGGGLPVRSPAPEFALSSLSGKQRSLRSLLSDERPLLLVFTDAGCGPCEALLPDLGVWQRTLAEWLAIVIVASGGEERNRDKTERYGLDRVLLQQQREVSDAYQAYGTPTAVVVGGDGLIASPVVGGADAVRTLVGQATQLFQHGLASRNGNAHRTGVPVPPAPGTSRVGAPVPDLTLTALDGGRVALADMYAERILAVFWDPGCGFCQRMLPDLKAFEDDPPAGAPRLVVISGGDPGAVRAHQLRSQVLLDPGSEAMRAFNAGGTPMGVLIENGRVASPVVAGAGAVLELATARANGENVPQGVDDVLGAARQNAGSP